MSGYRDNRPTGTHPRCHCVACEDERNPNKHLDKGRRQAVEALYAEAERLRDCGQKKAAGAFAAAACFLELGKFGSGARSDETKK